MSTPSVCHSTSDARWRRTSTAVPHSDRARKALRVAINFVFGMPFLWALVVAVRGPWWWAGHRLFEASLVRYSALLWGMVVALGALWLGVSLMFARARAGRLAGALLVLFGAALLVGLHP
jgi:uncharacterized membrane protein